MPHPKRNNTWFSGKIYLRLCCGFCITSIYGQQNKRVPDIKWDKITGVSKTTATLQIVENPMVRPGSTIHKKNLYCTKRTRAEFRKDFYFFTI